MCMWRRRVEWAASVNTEDKKLFWRVRRDMMRRDEPRTFERCGCEGPERIGLVGNGNNCDVVQTNQYTGQ